MPEITIWQCYSLPCINMLLFSQIQSIHLSITNLKLKQPTHNPPSQLPSFFFLFLPFFFFSVKGCTPATVGAAVGAAVPDDNSLSRSYNHPRFLCCSSIELVSERLPRTFWEDANDERSKMVGRNVRNNRCISIVVAVEFLREPNEGAVLD